MTRQRLREGSIKWETQLSLESFSQKILKKIQNLAFTEKVKIVKTFVPKKVQLFIEENFIDELNSFQKKYSIKIDIIEEDQMIIPEYRIELLNKSKKLIETTQYVNKIFELQKNEKSKIKIKKESKKLKKETKKVKTKKKLRTLWVRRKKKLN